MSARDDKWDYVSQRANEGVSEEDAINEWYNGASYTPTSYTPAAPVVEDPYAAEAAAKQKIQTMIASQRAQGWDEGAIAALWGGQPLAQEFLQAAPSQPALQQLIQQVAPQNAAPPAPVAAPVPTGPLPYAQYSEGNGWLDQNNNVVGGGDASTPPSGYQAGYRDRTGAWSAGAADWSNPAFAADAAANPGFTNQPDVGSTGNIFADFILSPGPALAAAWAAPAIMPELSALFGGGVSEGAGLAADQIASAAMGAGSAGGGTAAGTMSNALSAMVDGYNSGASVTPSMGTNVANYAGVMNDAGTALIPAATGTAVSDIGLGTGIGTVGGDLTLPSLGTAAAGAGILGTAANLFGPTGSTMLPNDSIQGSIDSISGINSSGTGMNDIANVGSQTLPGSPLAGQVATGNTFLDNYLSNSGVNLGNSGGGVQPGLGSINPSDAVGGNLGINGGSNVPGIGSQVDPTTGGGTSGIPSSLSNLFGNAAGAAVNWAAYNDIADKYIQAAKDLQRTGNPLNDPQRQQYQTMLSNQMNNPQSFWETDSYGSGLISMAGKQFQANSAKMGTGGTQFSDYLSNLTDAAGKSFNEQATLRGNLGGFNMPAQGTNASANLLSQGVNAQNAAYTGLGNLFGNNVMTPSGNTSGASNSNSNNGIANLISGAINYFAS